MKLKISFSKRALIIFLFLATYLYCNIASPLIFPSEPNIFIVTKIIPLILISLFSLPIGKIPLTPISKIWFLCYFFFVLVSLISTGFSENPYISFRVLFINFFLTLPLLIFHNYINSMKNFELMIRIITIFYLIFCIIIIYNELFLLELSSKAYVGGFKKGSVTNLGILGLTLFLLEKKTPKFFLIIFTFMILFFSLSVKFFLLTIIFLILTLLFHKKIVTLFLIFLISFIIWLVDFSFTELLLYIKNLTPEFYNTTIQRFIALFGYQDVSDYAISDVVGNIEVRLESLKLFFNNPIFGIGLENERVSSIGTMAHSGLISILIGSGIIGFCFFYFFIFYVLLQSLKYKYNDVIIICIMYLFYSLANPIYSNPNTVIILFIASSLFILRRSKFEIS